MLSVKRAFCQCNLRFFGVSRLNLSLLRQGASKNSEIALTKQKAIKFVPVRGEHSKSWEVNTNVINNVLLYKYEKQKMYAFLNALAPIQCAFWMFTAYYYYGHTSKRDRDKETLSQYINKNFIAFLIAGTALLTGPALTFMIYTLSARSIKYIILKKGGNAVTFFTYKPFKQKVGITVPVEHVSCRIPRRNMINYIPLRLKGRSLFYILDASGEFINPRLFDCTVGYVRSIK